MTKHPIAGAALSALAALSLIACKPAAPAKPAVDAGKIAAAVKADADQLVADLNAHDADKVVSHDAPDIVQMAHGSPNVVGLAADLARNKSAFADDPAIHVSVSAESVDVAAAGDMAVYRSTYEFTATDPKTNQPATETGNYLAGYRPQPDGSWKMAWSVVSDVVPDTPAGKR